jgi:uncharacterized BrkB/YihY/UPF0761 family membrane protein
MIELHTVVGVLVIVINVIAALVGLYYLRRRRSPSRTYLHLVAGAQVTVVAQAAIGLLLLSGGNRAVDELHYLYGAVALFVILSPWLYAPSDPSRRLVWFTGATVLAAVLGIRGYMTGGA